MAKKNASVRFEYAGLRGWNACGRLVGPGLRQGGVCVAATCGRICTGAAYEFCQRPTTAGVVRLRIRHRDAPRDAESRLIRVEMGGLRR
jgi:hypothetical protein